MDYDFDKLKQDVEKARTAKAERENTLKEAKELGLNLDAYKKESKTEVKAEQPIEIKKKDEAPKSEASSSPKQDVNNYGEIAKAITDAFKANAPKKEEKEKPTIYW